MLGMSKPGVIRAINRGVLSEVIDTECVYRGRRLLRDDVEEMARAQASEKEGESKVGELMRRRDYEWGLGTHIQFPNGKHTRQVVYGPNKFAARQSQSHPIAQTHSPIPGQ